SVLLDTFQQPVWKDNEIHRLVYSAALYASPRDTVEEPEPVVQRPASSEPEVKKEKKGLRKFLDKIFGRKKKNEDKKNE
ncbi:MAG TPA: hypothetical protein VER36_11235, partial [Flavisolibacter sp.]|nr:hypothetical protein [Flavisolibacter sp.]